MVFSSLTFLCIFLPAFLALYMISENVTYRNIVLTGASLLFYAWGEPSFLVLLIAASFVNFLLAEWIAAFRGTLLSKVIFVFTVILDIAMIGVFKYAGMITGTINTLLHLSIPIPNIGLPLGISFYTFQILTYVVDVYRGDVRVQHSYLKFLTFVSMFPQLIAGPIVRYSSVAKNLKKRTTTMWRFTNGASQFIIGLAKKVFLANFAGEAKDVLFAASTHPTMLSAWLGIIFYSFQLYFDFGGYSDMAIGLGRMIGFRFPQNFNYPYISRSVTEFWHRWHMTLSSFFKDYVYIPLGGNRVGALRHILNIMIVWTLTGLWHGASWNFVLWGVYYGVLLIIEKYIFNKWTGIPILSNIITLFFVVLGWGLFYFTDIAELKSFFMQLAGIECEFADITAVSTLYSYCILLGAMIIASTPIPFRIYKAIIAIPVIGLLIEAAVLTALLAGSIALLTGEAANPFLYFRF